MINDMKNVNTTENDISFEDAMKRLEEITREMSGDSVRLEDSLKLYEEGVRLIRCVSAKLEDAERKISILRLDQNGEISETPFEG